jgi:hypothetical protein
VSQTDVEKFISNIEDTQKRTDSEALVALMRDVTGAEPAMWGPSVVGFGNYHYKSASGREGDWFVLGFSPRKQNLTLYLSSYVDQHRDLLQGLGKHTTGKGCVYLKRLSDADPKALRRLLEAASASPMNQDRSASDDTAARS